MFTVKRFLLLLGALAALLLVSGVAAGSVQTQAIERPRQVIAGGGTSATASGVTLRATLGQPFVGSGTSGNVRLGHGFWGGGHIVEAGYVYLPVVLKSYP